MNAKSQTAGEVVQKLSKPAMILTCLFGTLAIPAMKHWVSTPSVEMASSENLAR